MLHKNVLWLLVSFLFINYANATEYKAMIVDVNKGNDELIKRIAPLLTKDNAIFVSVVTCRKTPDKLIYVYADVPRLLTLKPITEESGKEYAQRCNKVWKTTAELSAKASERCGGFSIDKLITDVYVGATGARMNAKAYVEKEQRKWENHIIKEVVLAGNTQSKVYRDAACREAKSHNVMDTALSPTACVELWERCKREGPSEYAQELLRKAVERGVYDDHELDKIPMSFK